QAGPLLGDYDAVLGVAGLVANRTRQAGPHIGGIQNCAHVGDVLGALDVDAADAVVVDEHGESAAIVTRYVANLKQVTVNQAAGLGEEGGSGQFQFFGRGPAAEDEPYAERRGTGDDDGTDGD